MVYVYLSYVWCNVCDSDSGPDVLTQKGWTQGRITYPKQGPIQIVMLLNVEFS